jgi:hypothetical protein
VYKNKIKDGARLAGENCPSPRYIVEHPAVRPLSGNNSIDGGKITTEIRGQMKGGQPMFQQQAEAAPLGDSPKHLKFGAMLREGG